jgi:hypothetical protein
MRAKGIPLETKKESKPEAVKNKQGILTKQKVGSGLYLPAFLVQKLD